MVGDVSLFLRLVCIIASTGYLEASLCSEHIITDFVPQFYRTAGSDQPGTTTYPESGGE